MLRRHRAAIVPDKFVPMLDIAILSTLRFDDHRTNLATSLNGLMRRSRFVKRKARSH